MRYISIRQILDDTLDHPLLRDVSFERAVNYAVQFMRIVGCPRIFEEKTELVEVKDYRALLPCVFESIIQVRRVYPDKSYEVLRASTDSFHTSPIKDELNTELTYKLQGNVILTSFRDGMLEVAFNSIKVDSDGYVMIPDNSAYINALELYIKKKCFTVLFDMNKISVAVLNNVQAEYSFAVGQAQSEMIKPSIDQMQALVNQLTALVPRVTSHSSGFINLGTQEKLRVK